MAEETTGAGHGLDEVLPQGWRPSGPGDSVEGVVEEIGVGWSDWANDREGGEYPVVTVRRPDSSLVSVHCFHTALLRRMMSLQPQLGEQFRCVYLGLKERPDGTRVHRYHLTVPGRTHSDAYERIAAAETRSTASTGGGMDPEA